MIQILFSLVFFSLLFIQTDNRIHERQSMVRHQIEGRGLRDSLTLKAMRSVPRHRFVPEAQSRNAYDDSPLPIGYGQTISQPYIVAYMTEIAQLQKNSTVLEIGTGSGYQAAVLAEITNTVYTIEIVKQLGESAVERLTSLGYKNIFVKIGDGYEGWKEHAPFDAIIVTAAADHVPPPLIQQLKEGGRMVIPVGAPFFIQTLMLVEKKEGKITTRSLMPVRFVPFTRSD